MLRIDTSERAAKFWLLLLLRGVAAVFLGVALLIWPHPTLGAFRLVFIVYALVDGIVAGISALRSAIAKEQWWRRATEATVAIVAAVAVWVWPHAVLTVIGYLIGIALALRGLVQLVGVIRMRAQSRIRSWLIAGAILSLIVGAIFLFSPRNGLDLFVWTLAVYGLVFGSILIAIALRLREALRDAEV